MFCDAEDVRKADARKPGGVGTESQIISQEVYAKVDQTKFSHWETYSEDALTDVAGVASGGVKAGDIIDWYVRWTPIDPPSAVLVRPAHPQAAVPSSFMKSAGSPGVQTGQCRAGGLDVDASRMTKHDKKCSERFGFTHVVFFLV